MDYLSDTAKALGISKSTVCKAISHSKYISYDTQRKIIDYIKLHYPEKLDARNNAITGNKDTRIISVVMPYKPKFFWDIAIDGMREAMKSFDNDKVSLQFSFYSGTLHASEILSVINEVNIDSVDAMAIVPVNSVGISEKINSISERIPVALFNERCDNCNNFISVLGDGYGEGTKIAEMISDCVADNSKILIIQPEKYDSLVLRERIKGFTDTTERLLKGKSVTTESCEVEYPDDINTVERTKYLYNSLLPSLMARAISKHLEADENISAVYIPNGNIHPLSIALNKLGRTDIMIFGHETSRNTHELFMSGSKGGYVEQNIRLQGYIAIDALAEKLINGEKKYPDTYITDFESNSFR